jgi:hypothetical protein
MVAEMHQLADIGAATINITIVNMLNINNNFTGIRIAYINAGAYLQNSSPLTRNR